MTKEERLKYLLSLKAKAFAVLDESQRVRAYCDKCHQDIQDFMQQYPEDEVMKMHFLEREKVLGKAEVLFEQMRQLDQKLKDLDKQYQAVRKEANEYYGREVMIDIPTPPLHTIQEPPDEADWWKTAD